MGLIVKKDDSERDYIDGIEVIERSDTPDDLPEVEVELIGGAFSRGYRGGCF